MPWMSRALAHGAYVGATGDLKRLRQIRAEAVKATVVQDSWNNVGRAPTDAGLNAPTETA